MQLTVYGLAIGACVLLVSACSSSECDCETDEGAGGATASKSGAESGGAALDSEVPASGGSGAENGGTLVGGTNATGAEASDAGGGRGGSLSGVGGQRSADGGASSATGGAGGQQPKETGIRIEGRQIYLDGEPFYIRGVNWNPVPKGASHPDGLDFVGFASQDISLMQAAGINCVRTYERIESVEVLDKLAAAGIFVFSTVLGWHEDNADVVIERVNAVKDHPAILAWVLGNEWNYNQLYKNDGDTDAARDKINEAAALIRTADSAHLITTIWGGTSGLADMVNQMPEIDLWGVNFYGGLSLGDVFDTFEAGKAMPMYLGEYGADAYNATAAVYDPESQAEATQVLTQLIVDNYAIGNTGISSGGFLFEWADEWWKDGAGSTSEQDVGGIAPGGGPHPDQVFNEEYWGIVTIDRIPRPAYDVLKALYAP